MFQKEGRSLLEVVQIARQESTVFLKCLWNKRDICHYWEKCLLVSHSGSKEGVCSVHLGVRGPLWNWFSLTHIFVDSEDVTQILRLWFGTQQVT